MRGGYNSRNPAEPCSRYLMSAGQRPIQVDMEDGWLRRPEFSGELPHRYHNIPTGQAWH